MLTVAELKALLRSRGLRLTKRLGQHHLIDARIIERIVEAARLSPGDTVVEIGAGLGALTEPLARRAGRVLAVELDRRIAEALAERMRPYRNVTVVCEDILRFGWARVRGAVAVGAIPYQITSPLLVSLGEQRHALRRAVLVLQAEVADRLLARPGTKAYGRLSLLGQYGFEIAPLVTVPRSAFFPQPGVDSRCVQLVPRDRTTVPAADEPFFFEVVKQAFSHRRKTLINCLSEQAPRAQVEAVLKALGLPGTVRGEALSLSQFTALADALRPAS